MSFPQETPLEDVLKYIKDATQDEAAGLPTGIPIYVDPVGLQDADKTMREIGRPSKLRHPSPRHETMNFLPPNGRASVMIQPDRQRGNARPVG